MLIQRIVTLLKEKELKKSDLCKHLGINNSTMANWQSRNTDPPSKYIIPICEFLDVSPYYLLTGSEREVAKDVVSETDQKALDTVQQLPEYKQHKDLSLTERIKEKAKSLGCSFASIERSVGIGNGAIRRWDTNSPSAANLKAVADFLNCSMEYLLTGEESTKNNISISSNDQEILELLHQLPKDVQQEYKAEMRGYVRAINKKVSKKSLA